MSVLGSYHIGLIGREPMDVPGPFISSLMHELITQHNLSLLEIIVLCAYEIGLIK